MSKTAIKLFTTLVCCAGALPVFSATVIDVSKENIQFLNSFLATKGPTHTGALASDLKEARQSVDFNKTMHVHLNQTYAGYPVFGGEVIVHVPNATNVSKGFRSLVASQPNKTTMNGILYQDLNKDLQNTPNYVFSAAQAEKALNQYINKYAAQKGLRGEVTHKQSDLMVYVDNDNKAHWAFYVSFYSDEKKPSKPVYIVDAVTLEVYRKWDDVKTLEIVEGGGYGGNPNMGRLVYDGLKGNLPKLEIKRNPRTNICYLMNDHVVITDYKTRKTPEFNCQKPNQLHNGVYWSGALHAVNSGYSPDNDALYAGKIVLELYQKWFNIPVLHKTGSSKALQLAFVTHSLDYNPYRHEYDPDNAFWNPEDQRMYFGDGKTTFYPLTSVGVTAHEVSHGFTEQHSALTYSSQSGGMDEAFSDMAAQAAEFYVTDGKNSWQIGSEIVKARGTALRYLDKPTKDCGVKDVPGEDCSIDKMTDYDRYISVHKDDPVIESLPDTRTPDPHLSSGIYNRVFYLMANSSEWGEYKESFRKAFNVMVKANQDHWTANSTFVQGACGLLKAAADYKYDPAPIKRAFADVELNIGECR